MSGSARYLFILAIVLSGVCSAPASLSELPDPTIVGYSTPCGWYNAVPANVFDNNPLTEYASNNIGAGTHLDFDFGIPTAIAGFRVVQSFNEVYRTNGANLTFSNNSDFSNPVATVFVDTTGAWALQIGNLANSTVTVEFAPITARYVSWVVTHMGYEPPAYTGGDRGWAGASEMTFLTTPEPVTMALLGLGGLIIARKRG